MNYFKNLLVLTALIISSCVNTDSSMKNSAGKWVGEGDYNGKAFQLGTDKDMELIMNLVKAYNAQDVNEYRGLHTDEYNEEGDISDWFNDFDSLSWVPFVVVPMELETGEHRVVHVWSNEFRKWNNGSTQNVELMEVFGIKDDKVDWFRQWSRHNPENEFGLRSGGKYFGRGESEYNGRSLVFSNRGEVEILEKLFKDYNNMDGDSVKMAFADTVRFLAANGSVNNLVAANWEKLFESIDSVRWTPISIVPLKIENTDPNSGALVTSNEVRYYKDGTVFNKDLVELFYFNLDKKISGVNQWERETEVDISEDSESTRSLILPEEVSPDVYKVILDNEDVKVLEVTFAPGQGDNMHEHGVITYNVVKGGKLQSTLPDGTVNEMNIPEGFIGHGNTLVKHQMKNIGEDTVKVIMVEHKNLKPIEE